MISAAFVLMEDMQDNKLQVLNDILKGKEKKRVVRSFLIT